MQTEFKNLPRWDARFLGLTCSIAAWSKDDKKVGCVLIRDRRILATGFNGLPRGMRDDPARIEQKPFKRLCTVHAEANAIAFAADSGTSVRGADCYCTHPPCSQCAAALVQAGIKRVVHFDISMSHWWRESLEVSKTIFDECGVDVVAVAPMDNVYKAKRRRKAINFPVDIEPSVEANLAQFFGG